MLGKYRLIYSSLTAVFFVSLAACRTAEVRSEAESAPSYEVFSDELIQSLITRTIESREMLDYLALEIAHGKTDQAKLATMAEDVLVGRTESLLNLAANSFRDYTRSDVLEAEDWERLEKLAKNQINRVNVAATSLKRLVRYEGAACTAANQDDCQPLTPKVALEGNIGPELTTLSTELSAFLATLLNWRDAVVTPGADLQVQRLAQGIYLSFGSDVPCVMEVYPDNSEIEGKKSLQTADLVAVDSQWLSADCRSASLNCADSGCLAGSKKLEFGPNQNGFYYNAGSGWRTFARVDLPWGEKQRASFKSGVYAGSNETAAIVSPGYSQDQSLAHLRLEAAPGQKQEPRLYLCGLDNCERRCSGGECPEKISLTPDDKFALQNASGDRWIYTHQGTPKP